MNTEHLIQMANQIGAFFAAEPNTEIARAGIADHIARFWEKRMRQSLYSYIDTEQETQLSPLVYEALIQHRNRIAQ